MNAYVRSLLRLAENYRGAEVEVVKAYFRKPRHEKSHIRWLEAQAFKEYSAIRPLLQLLTNLHGDLGRAIDRHEYERLAEKLEEETKHMRLIVDLLEEIGGKRLTPKLLPWLPEDRKLAKVRARYSRTYAGLLHGSGKLNGKEIRRKDEALERAAITLTEGGGGALYEVCNHLTKGRIERKIAAAFREIHADGVEHKNVGARGLVGLVRSRKDYERAAEVVREVSAQRLRMRNEQFGFPLSEENLRALDEACASRDEG
jgi:hypothetical protein